MAKKYVVHKYLRSTGATIKHKGRSINLGKATQADLAFLAKSNPLFVLLPGKPDRGSIMTVEETTKRKRTKK